MRGGKRKKRNEGEVSIETAAGGLGGSFVFAWDRSVLSFQELRAERGPELFHCLSNILSRLVIDLGWKGQSITKLTCFCFLAFV